MAISLKTAGTWARMVTDGGTVAIPGTPAAGDRMFLFGTWKDFSITVATPNGWTPIGSEFADGSVSAGNGTGSMKVRCFYRDWQSGDAAPAIDYSAAPTEGFWVIMLWQKGASDTWAAPKSVTAGFSAPLSSWSNTASSTVDIADGAVVMELVGLRDDAASITRTATTAIEDDGTPDVTWNGNYVESPATHISSTTGLDAAADLGHRFVTTGASGVSLTGTGTLITSETGATLWVVQELAGTITGTGALAAQAADITGSGTSSSTGTGALTAQAATIDGTGTAGDSGITGTGALVAQAATMAGTGTSSSTGSGALAAQAADITGAGTSSSTGAGALSAQAAAVDGTGTVSGGTITGTGALNAQAATMAGSGTVSGGEPPAPPPAILPIPQEMIGFAVKMAKIQKRKRRIKRALLLG